MIFLIICLIKFITFHKNKFIVFHIYFSHHNFKRIIFNNKQFYHLRFDPVPYVEKMFYFREVCSKHCSDALGPVRCHRVDLKKVVFYEAVQDCLAGVGFHLTAAGNLHIQKKMKSLNIICTDVQVV